MVIKRFKSLSWTMQRVIIVPVVVIMSIAVIDLAILFVVGAAGSIIGVAYLNFRQVIISFALVTISSATIYYLCFKVNKIIDYFDSINTNK